jgi:hypothetical protein
MRDVTLRPIQEAAQRSGVGRGERLDAVAEPAGYLAERDAGP